MEHADAESRLDAYECFFGTQTSASLIALSDGVAHIAMCIGQHHDYTRRFKARCGAFEQTVVTKEAYPTCVACIGHVFEKRLPL